MLFLPASLLLLTLVAGLAPLTVGMVRLKRDIAVSDFTANLGSAMLCGLAFNLTFFWQELWLVIPKALTPGLHPILFHNDHQWIGDNPVAELLQGTGAIATLASGLFFAALKRRLFFFWMAFQGLFQSLLQLAIGTLLPGNDLGRALAYLQIGETMKIALLLLSVVAMAGAGAFLSRRFPQSRGLVVLPALLAIIDIIPFRIPRDLIEVFWVPLIINLIGAAWVVVSAPAGQRDAEPVPLRVPALALAALLLIFQLVLRPGIQF